MLQNVVLRTARGRRARERTLVLTKHRRRRALTVAAHGRRRRPRRAGRLLVVAVRRRREEGKHGDRREAVRARRRRRSAPSLQTLRARPEVAEELLVEDRLRLAARVPQTDPPLEPGQVLDAAVEQVHALARRREARRNPAARLHVRVLRDLLVDGVLQNRLPVGEPRRPVALAARVVAVVPAPELVGLQLRLELVVFRRRRTAHQDGQHQHRAGAAEVMPKLRTSTVLLDSGVEGCPIRCFVDSVGALGLVAEQRGGPRPPGAGGGAPAKRRRTSSSRRGRCPRRSARRWLGRSSRARPGPAARWARRRRWRGRRGSS